MRRELHVLVLDSILRDVTEVKEFVFRIFRLVVHAQGVMLVENFIWKVIGEVLRGSLRLYIMADLGGSVIGSTPSENGVVDMVGDTVIFRGCYRGLIGVLIISDLGPVDQVSAAIIMAPFSFLIIEQLVTKAGWRRVRLVLLRA